MCGKRLYPISEPREMQHSESSGLHSVVIHDSICSRNEEWGTQEKILLQPNSATVKVCWTWKTQ
jgi:hypothetical protein